MGICGSLYRARPTIIDPNDTYCKVKNQVTIKSDFRFFSILGTSLPRSTTNIEFKFPCGTVRTVTATSKFSPNQPSGKRYRLVGSCPIPPIFSGATLTAEVTISGCSMPPLQFQYKSIEILKVYQS